MAANTPETCNQYSEVGKDLPDVTVTPITVSGECCTDFSFDPQKQEITCDLDDVDPMVIPDEVPTIDPLTTDDVTEVVVSGNGIFDIYMRAGSAQLDEQYKLNRIKGADYAAAHTAMMQLMMTEANKMAVAKVQADIQIEMFRIEFLNKQLQATLLESQIKKTVLEQDSLCIQMEEGLLNGATDRALKKLQAEKTDGEIKMICQQVGELVANGAVDRTLKSKQIAKTIADSTLVKQQREELKANGAVERTLKDVQTCVQTEQKKLYAQQITSFKDKTKIDATKIALDAWAVQAVEEPASTFQITAYKEGLGGSTFRGATENMLTLGRKT